MEFNLFLLEDETPTAETHYSTWQSLTAGLDYWTGLLDWTTGLLYMHAHFTLHVHNIQCTRQKNYWTAQKLGSSRVHADIVHVLHSAPLPYHLQLATGRHYECDWLDSFVIVIRHRVTIKSFALWMSSVWQFSISVPIHVRASWLSHVFLNLSFYVK